MPTLVEYAMSGPADLRTLGTSDKGTVQRRDANGNLVTMKASPLEQQRALVNQIIKSTRRSTLKYITAKFAATADAQTYVLGNAGKLSADATSASVTETYQNAGGAAGSAAAKTAFLEFIKYSPFRFVGVKIEVSDKALFNNTYTELINDVDSNDVKPFNDKIDAGQNVYSQEATTRLLNIAGEFGPCWGIKSTLDDTQWAKWSFNCVEIQRAW